MPIFVLFVSAGVSFDGAFSLWVSLRKKTEFKRINVKTVYNGTETLTFRGPRI